MSPATTRSYYPALDGLRGIAILLVIFHHNYDFLPLSTFTWFGVDLFFVLSGFLITDILLRTKGQKNFLQNFYLRRALRIFPLYYIGLLLFFLLVPFISQLHEQYKYYHDNQQMAWFHLTNWLYIFEHRPNTMLLLGHFWSLSIEEQFYLIWPFVILLCRNLQQLARAIKMILAACILFRLISWLQWGGGYTGFSFQYMTRIDGLCIGSLVAIWRLSDSSAFQKKLTQFALIVLGIYLCVFSLSLTIFPGLPHTMLLGYTIIGAVFGIVIVLAISPKTTYLNRILENKWLMRCGKISYGLYIFHWPVLSLFRLYFWNQLSGSGLNDTVAQLILSTSALLVSILVSVLSYVFFERRILALKDVVTAEGFFVRLRQKLLLLLRPASAKQ
jgi:peptidoglycan/LPS O-acetylase OafA/YrhL